MKHIFLSAALGCAALFLPASASAVGAPFLTIEKPDVTAGSILDFFDVFGPTGVKEVSLRGSVTSSIGANVAGRDFAFSTDQTFSTDPNGSGGASLTLGNTTITGSSILSTSADAFYDFDPIQSGPGDLNFLFIIEPPSIDSAVPNPNLALFEYLDDFEDWPDRISDFPGFEVQLSVYLDGPLPMRTFTTEFGETFDYIEGALPVSRITLGTIDGAPIAPIPLPAGLPLLAAALGGLAVVRRRAA